MSIKKNLLYSFILALVVIFVYVFFIKPKKLKNNFVDLKLKSTDNQDFYINKLKGKVIVVSFFQTWCSDCVKEKPELEKLKLEFENKDFELIYVTDESFEKINLFKEKFPSQVQYYQSEIPLKNLGISRYPTTFLLNKNQEIVLQRVEGINWYNQEIIEKIKSLL